MVALGMGTAASRAFRSRGSNSRKFAISRDMKTGGHPSESSEIAAVTSKHSSSSTIARRCY